MTVNRPQVTKARSWLGPVLLAIGLTGLAIIWLEAPDERSAYGWWVLTNAGAFQRVLPLIGLGILMALIDLRASIAGFALFAVGIILGFAFAEMIVAAMTQLPTSPERHHFLTAPALSIAVGLALVAPSRMRIVVLPVVAFAGVALAVAIWTTSPLGHDLIMGAIGIGIAIWIVGAAFLTVRAFRQSWFNIGGRILGSWLIAIGVLYGGACVIPIQQPPLRPPQMPSERLTVSGFELGPGAIGRPRDDDLPEGFNPSRQP